MNLREIYDGFAETYEKNRGLFDMTDVLDPFYKSLDIQNGNMLDLGCGAGEPFARYFIDRGWKVTGIDFSRQMLKLATKYAPEMQTIHADMCEIDFEPCQFDAIIAIYSLFHVSSDEFDGYKEFMKQQLYYSHKSPDKLYTDLENIGFEIESADYRNIGNEIFLWVTVSKPIEALISSSDRIGF
jgi:SAM-dependent methyltransferase